MAIKYAINKEKRTVVAIMTEVDNDVYNLILKYFKGKVGNDSRDWVIAELLDSFGGHKAFVRRDKLVAKAKCHPNDIWDAEKGKRIAKYKLLMMYRRYVIYVTDFATRLLHNHYMNTFNYIFEDNFYYLRKWETELHKEVK